VDRKQAAAAGEVLSPGEVGGAEPLAAPAEPPTPAGTAPVTARATAGRFDRSIVEGPIHRAVWKLAWPTMLGNIVGGLQGMVDHAMVGHFVGYTGNAAIGVSWQIFLVVIVFVSSLYTGMAVMVARFVGAGDAAKVNRTVYQAFFATLVISLGVLAPLGFVLSPALLDIVFATPEVRAEALPYLRIMFLFNAGMLVFFLLGGALRAAGDARTPLRFGIYMTVLNVVLNVILIPGLGPVPAFGTAGAAMGTVLASGAVGAVALVLLSRGSWVIGFRGGFSWRPDGSVIRSLFRFGLPSGFQGVAMNVAGVLLLRFMGSLERSAEAQAVYAVAYSQLFSLVTWTSVGLMGATAAVVGQNLGAKREQRAFQAVRVASRIGLTGALLLGLLFATSGKLLLGLFGMTEPAVTAIGVELLRFLSVSGLFITVALVYTGGLHGSGDTRSPLYISLISQIAIPIGLCLFLQETRGLEPTGIWLAILLGHLTRCALSVLRFRQGKWRGIVVDIEPAGR
jgi:putative MATE family efflux protein